MLDFERQELMDNLDWRTVLSAYRDGRESAKNADPDFDGWLERMMAVEGIDDEQLPRLHGKLLALGFLKFQLAGRSEGVRYQITSDGVRALDGLAADVSDDEPDEASDSEADETAARVSPTVLKFARA